VLQVGANFVSTNDAQIANIETVSLTAEGLTVDLTNQGTALDNTEGLVINAFANAALITGVVTPGTGSTPEVSTYTLNGLTAGQSIHHRWLDGHRHCQCNSRTSGRCVPRNGYNRSCSGSRRYLRIDRVGGCHIGWYGRNPDLHPHRK